MATLCHGVAPTVAAAALHAVQVQRDERAVGQVEVVGLAIHLLDRRGARECLHQRQRLKNSVVNKKV